MRTNRFGALGIVVWGALGAGAVACGSSFNANDCESTRTCLTDDQPGAGHAGASSDETSPGSGGAGGDHETASGGTAVVEAGGTKGGAGEPAVGGTDAGVAGSPDTAGAGGSDTVAPNPAPFVTAVSPLNDAENVEPNGKVTLTFSEPLAPATVTPANVRLLEGNTAVPGTVAYADSKVTFTPSKPLALLGVYDVLVSTAVTDVDGAGLEAEFRSSFSIRDGAFTTIDAAKGQFYQMADSLPINANGDVLVAWTADEMASPYCPPYAQFYNRGKSVAPAKALASGMSECDEVTAGANASGAAAVAWEVPDAEAGTNLKQYRGGQWSTAASKVPTTGFTFSLRLAFAPSGLLTFFYDEYGVGLIAQRTDAAGTLAAGPDVLATAKDVTPVRAPQAVFDSAGNGLLVWTVETSAGVGEIVTSRYTAASGNWATAEVLPGSAANKAGGAYDRGAAALAVDPKGNAIALWIRNDQGDNAALMASRFLPDAGWGDPERIASNMSASPSFEPPALVFDGQNFVAAFNAMVGTKYGTYVARYDVSRGVWGAPELRQAAADAAPIARMPRLATDPRGNLILVWASGTSPSFQLNYQRFANGAWSATKAVPGGTISAKYFDTALEPYDLSVNEIGLGALSWGNKNGDNLLSVIRLASFN